MYMKNANNSAEIIVRYFFDYLKKKKKFFRVNYQLIWPFTRISTLHLQLPSQIRSTFPYYSRRIYRQATIVVIVVVLLYLEEISK